MKLLRKEILINRLNAQQINFVNARLSEIESAIKLVVYPAGSSVFTIKPEKKANGVKPIKELFIAHLKEKGWKLEHSNADAVYLDDNNQNVAVEWETGNISSSHRSINRLMLGMINQKWIAGVLVVPSRKLYPYLTDRIGNYQELEQYFSIYQDHNKVPQGYLAIFEIEHDNEDENVPAIPKGTDGRALR
ncbi:MAG: hypothetical protein WCV67_13800 [Victivallaceae bacterium]|jgi:hypothetical protein